MYEATRDLIDNARWAIKLLAHEAKPYNHQYTCMARLTEAIAAVERGGSLMGPGSSSVECPHCHWGFAPAVIQQHIAEKHL
jgi:predicted oxidoreductase